MTHCEHCTKVRLGDVYEYRCAPLSSAVVSHRGGGKSVRRYLIQDCPTSGELTRGEIEGCLVSDEASNPRRSMMTNRGWANFDQALAQAKLQEIKRGRIFAEKRRLEAEG